jgi:hypothetical protein
MKKRIICFLAVSIFTLTGWSQVAPPGVKVTAAGLTVDSVFVLLQGKSVLLNPFPTGSKLSLNLSGIRGFSVRDNKTFPGCSMKVIDNSGKEILDYGDLFKEYTDGVDREDARYLDLSLTIGAPMMENANYRWKVRVWDKNGKAEMTVETPLSVSSVQDKLGIKKISKGITCQNAFIMMGAPLNSNQVKVGDELDFVVTGINGFSIQGDKVRIGASISVKDNGGDTILEYTDLFKSEDTYTPKEAETVRLNLKVGDPMAAGNAYTWSIKIWDKVTQKEFEASCLLDVN